MSPINIQASKRRANYTSNYNSQNKPSKNNIKVQETRTGFHYELKIPGYVREDFNFYVSGKDLVVTTEKSKTTISENRDGGKRNHNYCYPSAYFKIKIPLPSNIVSNKITVKYEEEVLSFNLFKISSY